MESKFRKIIIVIIVIFGIVACGYIIDRNFEEKCNNTCSEEKLELTEKYESKIEELEKEINDYDEELSNLKCKYENKCTNTDININDKKQ